MEEDGQSSSAATRCWTPSPVRLRSTRLGQGDAAPSPGRWPTSGPTSTGRRRSTISSSSACPTNFHYGNGMGTNPIQMMRSVRPGHPPQAHHERPVRVHRPPSATAASTTSGGPCGSWHDLFQHDQRRTSSRHEPVRASTRHQGGVHPQVPLRQRLHPFHGLFHDELRPPGRGAHQRHLHRAPGSRASPAAWPQDRATFEEAPWPTPRADTPAPTPTSWPCPHLHHCRRPPLHEGPRLNAPSHGCFAGRLSCKEWPRKG